MPIFHVAFSSREMLVTRQLLFLLIACITRNGVPSPASQAIVRRSAWSIPMFRTDFLPFTSQIVEHSRYLPAALGHKAPCRAEVGICDGIP